LIYNNLLYLLVVVLILSTGSVPKQPSLPLVDGLLFFLLKAFVYHALLSRAHRGTRSKNSRAYFATEQHFSILAVLSLAVDVYLLDCKYYFAHIPLAAQLPVLTDLAGISLFFCYLAMLWARARRSYLIVFERFYTAKAFILSNLKTNLPLILPWLLLSLLLDILQLIPLPSPWRLQLSQWGEQAILLFFFVLLAAVFPALIRRLWGCTPLPAGSFRSQIERFCHQQNFAYTEIMLWPLFEGRALTAGVMGISKKLRYLLVTPVLLETLTTDELEAVMAHEIGHVKKYHLQLYLVLFLGFSLLIGMIADPLLYLLLSSNLFYKITSFTHTDAEAALAFWGTVPLLLIMILYFRYVFGFFMRNFERQADLHVFTATGNSEPLVQSLEKIGWLSGNIRDLPSWHHFGIGQRVDFLNRCRINPGLIKWHDLKIYGALLLYLVVLGGSAGLLQIMPMDILKANSANKFVEAVLKQKIRQEPDNALWYRLMGDLKQENKQDAEARSAYEKALTLKPTNPEIMNNLAWLLVMSEKQDVREPATALRLAQTAADIEPAGYILDTLATAYWVNGFIKEAIATEQEAAARDPANRQYYRQQIEAFTTNNPPPRPTQGDQ